MRSILLSLKRVGHFFLLIVFISHNCSAIESSPIKKNGNLLGKDKFQQKKHVSSDKFLQFEKKSNSSFNKSLDKNIRKMKNIEINESNWSQHLAKIRKDAGINLSQESHILDNKESYNLVLQNMGYFEEMAEKMDLKSINRYQFRSNRPEGDIPVDNVAENAESMN